MSESRPSLISQFMTPLTVIAAAIMIAAAIWLPGPPPDWRSHATEFDQIASRLSNSNNPIYGWTTARYLQSEIRSGNLSDSDRIDREILLCRELTRLDQIDEAATLIDSAVARASQSPALQHWLAKAHEARAITYLRRAEISNCIMRHNADCCVFPLAGGGVHQDREPAEQARESLLFCLKGKPSDLRLRWLLNVVCMALGEYPDGVPAEFLIDPRVFESDTEASRFVDVAPSAGVNAFDLAGGAIVEDIDGDNLLDIVSSTCDPGGSMKYFRNRGDGTFEDLSRQSRLADQKGGLNCMATDYDNDGDIDIFVPRGAWLLDDGRIRNSLLRNNGEGTFTDVTEAAGLAWPAYPTQAAVWADFDNDGDLDLYIGNESRIEIERGAGDHPSQLFRNNGDGTFIDIASAAGVTNDRYAKGVAAGDFDNDGDIDIYVSNLTHNRLYRNQGDGTFVDVARQFGVEEPAGRSFTCWFFDVDNNGWLDLYVTGYEARVDDILADELQLSHKGILPRLYRNRGDGTFIDAAADMNLQHPYLMMGGNFGDIDNDGWLDIYMGTGDPDLQTLVPNVMLRNDKGKRFQDVTTATGLGHLQKGHGVAFADLDHDGDQDIFHQLGGFYPTDKFANALFMNPGPPAPGTSGENGHRPGYLVLQLRGVQSNRLAYGARINIELETPDGPRQIHRAVGSVSSFGGSPSRQEIGLGDATRIRRIEIFWPRSKTRQVFNDVPLNSAQFITEGENRLEPMPYRTTTLGGGQGK